MTATDTVTAAAPITHTRIRELRVKIKSLAEEARIIRREEQRCRDSLLRTPAEFPDQRAALCGSYASLRAHRITDVRRESRYSLLAYALLRGRAYRTQEAKADPSKIDRDKLAKLVARFAVFGSWHQLEAAAAAVESWLSG